MMTTTRRWASALYLSFTLCAGNLLLAACGGVGEEGTGIQPASASVGMVQGLSDTSLTVNGVSYAQSAANVSDGFGQPMAKDRTVPADEDCIDFYLRPYDRNAGVEDAMNAYLSWEIDLVHEIERDGTVRFGATH